MLGHFLELLHFIRADVAKIAFRKTVNEERPLAFAKQDDAAVALGLAFSSKGNPLFDDAATQVSIDFSLLRALNSIPKRIGRNFLLPRKPRKPCVLQNLQTGCPVSIPLWYHT